MIPRSISTALAVMTLLGLWTLPTVVLAHRLDEYLQATLVEIEPGSIQLQINLTPGVAVADKVLALIDRDRDGTISTDEAGAYAESLKRDLFVRLDGHEVKLQLTRLYCPGITELRTGWAFIQMEYSMKVGSLASGAHKIKLRNRHLPTLSVYLLNAAQPKSALIEITKQNRNENQSLAEIEFKVRDNLNSLNFKSVPDLISTAKLTDSPTH